MTDFKSGYNGNANLKQVGEVIEFTPEQVAEYVKCESDVEYFLEKYAKIVSLDDGVVPFKPFPYQKRILKALAVNRKILVKLFRQGGKSSIIAGYFAWYCLFKDNKNACILANKMFTAKEIFSRVQFIIEQCPKWLQQGVKEWNKTSFVLENGTRCFCAATSPSAISGQSVSLLLCDEFALLKGNLAEEFVASVFPTISSSEQSQLIIVSTPKGMNHYYKMWKEAELGLNGFVPIEGKWQEHPKRNQAWSDEQLAILGQVKYSQEILTSFIGSSNTLIVGEKIASLPLKPPTASSLDGFKAYYPPVKKTPYCMTVDVAEGGGDDYSTFTIFDISTLPYKIVATYRNNRVHTLTYPEVIKHYADMYNEAFVLVETNSLGQQVADALYYDLEYENMYMSIKDDVVEGFGARIMPGVKTTKKTKSIGCNTIKLIIESDQLEVNDSMIIDEMSTFTRKGSTFKADDGKTDDMMMTLVMFGFLTTTTAFKNLFDFSLRQKFIKQQLSDVESSELPMGFFDDGRDDTEERNILIRW